VHLHEKSLSQDIQPYPYYEHDNLFAALIWNLCSLFEYLWKWSLWPHLGILSCLQFFIQRNYKITSNYTNNKNAQKELTHLLN